ncbi:hypothetical protein OHB26_10130 [Nocardia sp. NBC_01503]|uniref:hypothetical protein n=1 Tax=Nocardia sp. NBC_01503 TaxID=2975997 RepID=UPI002E7BB39A|nr:hypothetical protein [Nocardia sp. NBC_01503]WTL34519.1 hypothetical protein OHB26_10130 [Nocardia sp. NBC_01503]
MNHCLGTLIAHADGSAECTDWACTDTDRLRHPYLADCSDIAGGCECVQPEFTTGTGRQTLAG